MNKRIIQNIILTLIIFSFALHAQNKSYKEKLKEVKGDAKEIIIKTDEGQFKFEGKEAEKLLKKMKSKMSKRVKWINKNIDIDNEDIQVFTDMKLDSAFAKFDFEIDEDSDSKVMVFKSEDSDDDIKVFTKSNIKVILDKMDDDVNFSTIALSSKDNDFNKQVQIEIEDDNKKVTVTEVKDGKKEKKVYEGKEAEEYLKENEDLDFEELGDKDAKSIMIIKKKKNKK